MSFTLEDYEKLQKAIVNGVQSVTYGDKTVSYRSLAEMKEALKIMETNLFPNRMPSRRRYASLDRGYFTKK